jgi:hypothetical protein
MPEDCLVEIVLEIVCTKVCHPHKFAHTACGNTDGIHWSVTWWDLTAVADDPDGPANEDRPVRVRLIPEPRDPAEGAEVPA